MAKIINKIKAIPEKYYQLWTKRTFDYTDNGQDAANKIYETLAAGTPTMISRFGGTEISALCRILTREDKRNPLSKAVGYISGKYKFYFNNKEAFRNLRDLSGVMNIDKQGLQDFKKEYLAAIPQIDIIGSWVYEEYSPYIKVLLKQDIVRIKLQWIEPLMSLERPWTRILKGKKVLVIHPFAKSIENQYARHEFLFENKETLPDFDLQVIKAVQSIAGESL